MSCAKQAVLLAGGLWLCAGAAVAEKAAGFTGLTAPPPAPVLPLAQPLQAGAAAATQSISCAVRASREVKVAAPVSGVVEAVKVRPGQQVKKGDVLARFDMRLIGAELALAEARAEDHSVRDTAAARVAGMALRHERLQGALKSRAVSQAEEETARLELDLARGELARAEAELRFAALEAARVAVMADKSEVKSPVDGMIGEMLINPGEAPDAQQPIAVIIVTDPLRVEAWVPAAKAPALLARTGHRAEIGGSPRDLIFDYAAAAADMSSGTISFFYTLSAPDLLPGLDCRLLTPAL
ncbi:efflux RND transporter periplasmic adaptor subunit [Falsigemmobacter faecalis]|uniref:Efflux RND transporter periplasmic adaptor subunit n=1 Tax=Falsigemmobacter faecalis TaxID=2488730 RepID=A0A3P3DJ52_9RHOB|nr:HlyD family secretion protein [Falsigemmobacter faecalis]RRH73844.1 efflux RND transporter periplasmic adaptor subunit [Falsigemmobacter faecalis]